MACNNPNKVFYVGINPETGKKKIFYTNRYVDYIWRKSPADHWHTVRIPESQTETHGIRNKQLFQKQLDDVPSYGATIIKDCDLVPCGQCLGCRLDYAKRWAARIMMETKYYGPKQCWFVTFTYNDDNLPKFRQKKESITIVNSDGEEVTKKYWFCQKYVIDTDTGEIKDPPFPSVSKREHELLMKRIRKHYGDGIRFFMSAEYGSKNFRCHMHYILFGLDKPSDLQVYKTNFNGDILYTSKSFTENVWCEIDEVTKQPVKDENGDIKTKGFVIFGEVTNESASYVARYTVKKRKNMPKEDYELLGLEPEFCLMSRKPGIGSKYFEDNYESIYDTDSIVVPTKNGAMSIKPPPYYDSILDRVNPDLLKSVKEKRKQNAELHDMLMAKTKPNLDLENLYEAQERASENMIIVKKGGDL